MRCRFRTNVKFAGNLRLVIYFNFQIFNLQEWILIISLFLFFSVQLYFILRYFIRTLFLKPVSEGIFENHISVVVAVRNEEEKIKTIIEELLAQHFSNFELIVVDDHSMDRTYELLFSLTRNYKNVKYTGIAQDVRFSEKMNINLGMKAAKSEWIIFTEAEVVNRDNQWLKKMNCYINDDIDAVVAYSNVSGGKGFVRYFYRIEKMWQYLQSTSFILGGRTLIADQDNVLIRKKIYFAKGGFRTHINKHYANLELILNEEINSKRIKIATSELAVKSQIDENEHLSFRNLMKKSMQIRRNLVAGSRIALFLEEYSRILLFSAFVLMFIFRPVYWEFSLILLLIYLLLVTIILGINQRRLKEQKLFLSSLAYILVRPLLVLFIGMSMIIKDRRDRWI